MCREDQGLAPQRIALRAFSCKAVIDCGMDAGLTRTRNWRVREDVDRVGAVTCGQHMQIRLALKSELMPGLAAFAALDQAKRVGESGT